MTPIEIIVEAVIDAANIVTIGGYYEIDQENATRAAIIALEANGYAIVPVEPSEAMLKAGQAECPMWEPAADAADVYRAMIAAKD